MGAADLLQRLRGAGFELQAADGMVMVKPISKLSEIDRQAIKACKPELIEMLATHATVEARPDQTCAGCRNRSLYGTCREPVAAGLAERFTILWPEADHAARCSAWTPR